MSLFGNTQPGNQARSSLFGGGNNTQQGSSLFGNNQPQQQPQQQTGSLFGGGNNQTQQQPQQQNGSLFGPNLAQQQLAQQQHPTQQGTFASAIGPVPGMNNSTPQQQNNSNLGNSNAPYSLNPLNQSTGQELAAHRLGQSNLYNRPNEKTVPAQVQTLIRKWDPQSQDTKLQSYLYNAVSSSYAPFYYRNVEEDEGDWEEALRNKPLPVEKDGESVSFVPVLVRGFHALGERVEYQAKTVNEMRASLNAVMAKHQQSLTVRLANAGRNHTALSQRTLRLAVKVQVLRSRGFALDAQEESLRKALLALQDKTFDGAFVAREEEIWARMVALRERARWLEEEGKRLGGAGEGEGKEGKALPEEVVVQAKRILRDYDGQISHLGKELEGVKKEFEEWEARR